MNHSETIHFFLQVGVLLFAALSAGHVARRAGLPAVLGELLAGLLLGPTLFGRFLPEAQAWLFPHAGPVPVAVGAVGKLGLLGFLFAAGLELDLSHVKREGRTVLLTSALGIVVPFLFGFAAVKLAPALWGAEGNPLLPFFVGTALSISALPVIARVLMDLRIPMTGLASVILASAVVDDLVGWFLFAALVRALTQGTSGPADILKTVVLVTGVSCLMLVAGRWVFRRAAPWIRSQMEEPGRFICLGVSFFVVSAALFEGLGVHAAFGAFLAGIVFSSGRSGDDPVHGIVYQVSLGVLAPLYFVSVGLTLDYVAHFDLLLSVVVFLIACLGKLIGAGLGAWWGGKPWREALAVGFALNARGAMEIVLASAALEVGMIERRLFVALVIVAVGTSLISGPALRRLIVRR